MTDRERLMDIFEKAGYLCQFPGTMARIVIENGFSYQRWIPVTERLPDKDGRYLCLTRIIGYNHVVLSFAKDGEEVGYYELTGKKNVWYEYDREWGVVSLNSVTHWMPLPEPPEQNN